MNRLVSHALIRLSGEDPVDLLPWFKPLYQRIGLAVLLGYGLALVAGSVMAAHFTKPHDIAAWVLTLGAGLGWMLAVVAFDRWDMWARNSIWQGRIFLVVEIGIVVLVVGPAIHTFALIHYPAIAPWVKWPALMLMVATLFAFKSSRLSDARPTHTEESTNLPIHWSDLQRSDLYGEGGYSSQAIEDQLAIRNAARAAGYLVEADRIRADLLAHGIGLQDHETGTEWFRTWRDSTVASYQIMPDYGGVYILHLEDSHGPQRCDEYWAELGDVERETGCDVLHLESKFIDWQVDFEYAADDHREADLDWPSFHERGIALARELKSIVGEKARIIYTKPPEDPGHAVAGFREVMADGSLIELPRHLPQTV